MRNHSKKPFTLSHVKASSIMLGIFLLCSVLVQAQTYPPTCSVTMPYNNAYYKAGSDIEIQVYSTDIGKTTNNGIVTEVEFFNGNKSLGKVKKHSNNTYSFIWKKAKEGIYTLRAKATNDRGVSFTSTNVIVTVGKDDVKNIGLSANKGKYLANIHQRRPSINYTTYWNGVTSENACKWESTEATRDVFTWGGADSSYNFAKNHHMLFRFHAALWASQYPKWLLNLTTEEAKEEVIENLKAIGERFPLADQIDVLNEQLSNHQRDNQKFRELFGGPGTKSNDYAWQIWLFEQARIYLPNTKLVLNDYGLEGDRKAINGQLDLFKVLRDRGLVDGFGTQAHCFNIDKKSSDTLKAHLDLMATSGLPIYATEMDMNGGIRGNQANDSMQLISFKNSFPPFWEHPAVKGITFWGYIQNTTWISGTGIVSYDGVENPSMIWLKSYMASRPNVGFPFGSGTTKK
jgi:GH35 family endo-1,4-beta-xylanase